MDHPGCSSLPCPPPPSLSSKTANPRESINQIRARDGRKHDSLHFAEACAFVCAWMTIQQKINQWFPKINARTGGWDRCRICHDKYYVTSHFNWKHNGQQCNYHTLTHCWRHLHNRLGNSGPSLYFTLQVLYNYTLTVQSIELNPNSAHCNYWSIMIICDSLPLDVFDVWAGN